MSGAAGTAGDRIVVTGIRARGHHGVLASEREAGQEFVVDVDLELDVRPAAATDDLELTVDYGALAERVAAAVERDPVDLIETLAERLAGVVLASPAVLRTRVTVHKPSAPIPVPFEDVAVTIERERSTAAHPARRAVLALGSNTGERRAILAAAVRDLATVPGVHLVSVAEPVETVAVREHGPDPDAPRYLNTVALVDTTLSARRLLEVALTIEAERGRVRRERWGDRTLDIDLVDVGGERVDEPDLVLPHPRAAERSFVVGPWASLDPDAELLGAGPVARIAARLAERSAEGTP